MDWRDQSHLTFSKNRLPPDYDRLIGVTPALSRCTVSRATHGIRDDAAPSIVGLQDDPTRDGGVAEHRAGGLPAERGARPGGLGGTPPRRGVWGEAPPSSTVGSCLLRCSPRNSCFSGCTVTRHDRMVRNQFRHPNGIADGPRRRAAHEAMPHPAEADPGGASARSVAEPGPRRRGPPERGKCG